MPVNFDAPSDADPSARFADLEARLNTTFNDHALLLTALTHPSYANEHPEDPTEHNERLEFLGDAVLGMIVARTLYQRFPEVPEGRLTEWRAYLVCGPTLSRVAGTLDLGPWLRLGRGEDQTGGREREGNLERAYEAIVGALYLDRGLSVARKFVRETLAHELATLEMSPDALNPKGALQELVQQLGNAEDDNAVRPEYVLVTESGPDHERHYEIAVEIDGEALGRGAGASKQQAEKAAAAEALERLRARLDDEGDDQSRVATRGDGH
ncbi:MAG: ribonuclease III [Chloroflexi bacterium]|nr:ribonuclease III [Chloroflexota bacterium]MDA1147604.1 ribonuclease III [Chloroflexota bacterium]